MAGVRVKIGLPIIGSHGGLDGASSLPCVFRRTFAERETSLRTRTYAPYEANFVQLLDALFTEFSLPSLLPLCP